MSTASEGIRGISVAIASAEPALTGFAAGIGAIVEDNLLDWSQDGPMRNVGKHAVRVQAAAEALAREMRILDSEIASVATRV